MMTKILLVAGARPNFMKITPLVHVLKRHGTEAVWKLVHTGQHYDYEMSKAFFEDLDLPEPDYFLKAGSGSHAEQTAKIMLEFEQVCRKEKPCIVVVVGDVNSTLACSITAKKLNIKVAHVEAGLRSGDLSMPEEINRIVTDSISDYLFVTEKSGLANLQSEGKKETQIFLVGNIMIDTLHYSLEKLRRMKGTGKPLFQEKEVCGPFGVLTLHRPSNVDDPVKLADILSSLAAIAREMPLYFPLHPRTRRNIEKFRLSHVLEGAPITLLPPLPYLEFLSLWKSAALVFTDSGGIQEETTALGIPCFTIRDNTERPITIEEGTNVLVGTTGEKIRRAYENFKSGMRRSGKIPELWDGKSAERIVASLLSV